MAKMNMSSKLAEYSTINGKPKVKCKKCGKMKSDCNCGKAIGTETELDRMSNPRIKRAPSSPVGLETEIERRSKRGY